MSKIKKLKRKIRRRLWLRKWFPCFFCILPKKKFTPPVYDDAYWKAMSQDWDDDSY